MVATVPNTLAAKTLRAASSNTEEPPPNRGPGQGEMHTKPVSRVRDAQAAPPKAACSLVIRTRTGQAASYCVGLVRCAAGWPLVGGGGAIVVSHVPR